MEINAVKIAIGGGTSRIENRFLRISLPATCCRERWSDGTIFEFLDLGKLRDVPKAVLDRAVSNIPIDGKKYALPEVDRDK